MSASARATRINCCVSLGAGLMSMIDAKLIIFEGCLRGEERHLAHFAATVFVLNDRSVCM